MRNRARWTARIRGCPRPPPGKAASPKGQHDDAAVARRRPACPGVSGSAGSPHCMRSSRRVRLPTFSSSSRGCSTGSARSPTGTRRRMDLAGTARVYLLWPHLRARGAAASSCRGSVRLSRSPRCHSTPLAHLVASLHDGHEAWQWASWSLLPVIGIGAAGSRQRWPFLKHSRPLRLKTRGSCTKVVSHDVDRHRDAS